MTSLRLDFDYQAIGDLALRSDAVRQLVADTAERMGENLSGEVGAENVVVTHAGKSRARSYVRRTGRTAAQDEVVDGALSRTLRGGASG